MVPIWNNGPVFMLPSAACHKGDIMQILSKRLMSAAAAAALVLGLAACGGSSTTTETATTEGDSAATVYKIATDTTFAPFEYAEADGTYVGIDVEILAAIAADQGFEYELEPLGFNAALQAVQADQADGVIAGMSITDERKEIFDFSQPYYDSTVCAAAADASITSLDALKGKTVAVKTGTMSESWAESIKDQYGFTTVQFDDSDVMYQDVIAGNTAACFEDTPVMSYAISTGNIKLAIIAEAPADSAYATPYGFAVNKGKNAELLSMFDAGLANIKADGTYDKIVNTYVQSVN